jgi:5-methylthioadenosine/S-adenosylhomocysteine deaminase
MCSSRMPICSPCKAAAQATLSTGPWRCRDSVLWLLAPMVNGLPPGAMAGWKLGDLYPLDSTVAQSKLDAAVALGREWDGAADGRITIMLGPHAPDMMLREDLLAIKHAAEREGWMLHMHVAQGDREIDPMLKRYGQRTPAYLDEIGYLDEQLLAVHVTEATDEETALVAQRGAQLAALFSKIRYRDPTAIPGWHVLRMATIEGAEAIGLGDEIGSLEAGKQADLILVGL